MSTATKEVFIRKLVLAWDPDYTKVTPAEAKRIEQVEEEIRRGEREKYGLI